jgi:ribonuclease HI
MAPPQSTKDI